MSRASELLEKLKIIQLPEGVPKNPLEPGWYVVQGKNIVGKKAEYDSIVSGPWNKERAREEWKDYEDRRELSVVLLKQKGGNWSYE